MQLIAPITVTDAMLTSSSLDEDDYPVWSSATVYAAGDRSILTSTHRIYQRLNAGSGPLAPNLDAANWVEVGPTNKWAPFDRAVGTSATSGADTTLSYTITPGQVVTGLALLDASCDAVSIQVMVSGETIYEKNYVPVLANDLEIGDWYSYFFESIQRRVSLIDTGLPAFSESVINVTLTGTAPLRVGTLALGRPYTIGTTLAGGRLSIIDYSIKTTDEFGTTTLSERAHAKRMEAVVVVNTLTVGVISQRLADIRATPVIWIGDNSIESTVIYGWCREWVIEMQYHNISHCSLVIEGLV